MLTKIGEAKRIIVVKYKENGIYSYQCRTQGSTGQQTETSNSHETSEFIAEQLLLLHDNACIHTVARSVETIENLDYEVLEYCAYRPNSLFPTITSSTCSNIFYEFVDLLQMKKCRKQYLNGGNSSTTFFNGVSMLEKCWKKWPCLTMA